MIGWLAGAPLTASLKADEPAFAVAVETIHQRGEAAVAGYQASQGIATGTVFSDLYFDVFEGSGMEMALARRDEALKVDLEAHFSTLIGAAMRGAPRAEVESHWRALEGRLHEVLPLVESREPSWRNWFGFR
ncbi:hypothetical protein [Rhodospirillum rubrum]|uniref:hypothetical protein n=1 Tax=Rhodospirillum rubrum TaxID=1085 RepID=UPI00003C29BF|nr:hypothetical protein [Rhodospirillum rubrum]AEO49297.1 hypothetical protein F11_14175 [Rhodospirillum rubrum F11]QXG79525.1 hypothetical protein KUL73_14245 [Rhodospirillum rubrum]